MNRHIGSRESWALVAVLLLSTPCFGQVVPGTGRKVRGFGDDFENPKWSYVTNGRKSSHEDDGRVRSPRGRSRNGRWIESHKRGQPDQIKRVETPAGGLPGSKGALLLRSRDTGVPGRPGYKMKQDDLLASTHSVSSSSNPNYVVRVYVPPYEQWEDRSGSSFGFRVGCRTTKTETEREERRGLFGNTFDFITRDEEEPYWPGMFIQFQSSHDGSVAHDSAIIACRGGRSGKEFRGPTVTPGWWTLGLSFSPDGAVHYYASEGVDPLTGRDRIGSSFPYGFRCERVTTMFFNICSPDDGKTWSTPWIVDDPEMFLASGGATFMEAQAPGMAVPPTSRSASNKKRRGIFGGLFR